MQFTTIGFSLPGFKSSSVFLRTQKIQCKMQNPYTGITTFHGSDKLFIPGHAEFPKRIKEESDCYYKIIYLIHPLILSKLYIYFSIDSLSFHPILSIIGISVFTFGLSLLISMGLNKIPVIKKYIV